MYRLVLAWSLVAAVAAMKVGHAAEGLKESDIHAEGLHEHATHDEETWTLVGKQVKLMDSEKDQVTIDDLLIDVSDPPVISDDQCPEIYDIMNTMPEKLKADVLKEAQHSQKEDYPPCFRSLNQYGVLGKCNVKFYVVYGRYRYCCPLNLYKHPLVMKKGRFIKCSCKWSEDNEKP